MLRRTKASDGGSLTPPDGTATWLWSDLYLAPPQHHPLLQAAARDGGPDKRRAARRLAGRGRQRRHGGLRRGHRDGGVADAGAARAYPVDARTEAAGADAARRRKPGAAGDAHPARRCAARMRERPRTHPQQHAAAPRPLHQTSASSRPATARCGSRTSAASPARALPPAGREARRPTKSWRRSATLGWGVE